MTASKEWTWAVVERDGVQHVVPEHDLRIHELAESCWCRPRDDAGVIVHNSADWRERWETR